MRRGGRGCAVGATVLAAAASLAVAGCRGAPITRDAIAHPPGPSTSAPAVLDTPTTLHPVMTTTTVEVPTTAPPTTGAPATTVRPAAPPTTAARPRITPAPAMVHPRPLPVSVVASVVAPAVVDIDAASGAQHAFGTGMVLAASGQILTNNHVVRGARTITVTAVSTGRAYAATVVGADATQDVALLQLQGPAGLVSVTVGGPVGPGDPVTTVGNTGGRGGTPDVRTGSVVATGQSLVASDAFGVVEHLNNLIEISAPSQPGDSGGPVANAGGQVIGMVVASAGGEGYAIPINTAIAVAQHVVIGP